MSVQCNALLKATAWIYLSCPREQGLCNCRASVRLSALSIDSSNGGGEFAAGRPANRRYRIRMELFAMAHATVNTQDRPLSLRNNNYCFNPTPSYCPLICY